MTTTVFLDTETTGLDPARHEPWEVALIVRGHHRPDWDGGWVFQLQVDLSVADAAALNVGRFWQRRHPHVARYGEVVLTRWPSAVQVRVNGDRAISEAAVALWQSMGHRDLARLLAELLAGAVVVGSNPAFDLAMLTALLAKQSIPTPWHYRPIDVVTLAAGYLRAAGGYDELTAEPAYRSEVLAAECGVRPPSAAERHTALGDARWVQRWYDALVRLRGIDAPVGVAEAPAPLAAHDPHVWAVGDVVRLHGLHPECRGRGCSKDGWTVRIPDERYLAEDGGVVDREGELWLSHPASAEPHTSVPRVIRKPASVALLAQVERVPS